MKKEIGDFRSEFARMDRASLLTAQELGQLLRKSSNAIYHMLCREPEALPKPVFRQNRYLRWRVGDVRDWIDALPSAEIQGNTTSRRGRPRTGVIA